MLLKLSADAQAESELKRTYAAEVIDYNILVVVGDIGKFLIIAQCCVSSSQLHLQIA